MKLVGAQDTTQSPLSNLCHYDKVYDALEKLTEPTENSDTRADAGTVLSSISTFSFISFLNLWFVGRRSAGGG